MTRERTFIMIKPDAVQRGLVGVIISRFQQRGFKIVALKNLTPTLQLAQNHYAEHEGKPFFERITKFISSSAVVAIIFEGDDVVTTSRKMIGATNPSLADLGTIRGDYGIAS